MGARCRRFESFRPDQKITNDHFGSFFIFSAGRGFELGSHLSLVVARHNCGAFVTVWSRYARPHLLIVAPYHSFHVQKQIAFICGAVGYNRGMKKLSDDDILAMAGGDFVPDARAVNKSVRAKLRLGTLIPDAPTDVPKYARLDLHQMTEDQAWNAIMELATSGVRRAQIITGASGILHQKFPQWARESILSPYIMEFAPINNGSFDVRFRRMTRDA